MEHEQTGHRGDTRAASGGERVLQHDSAEKMRVVKGRAGVEYKGEAPENLAGNVMEVLVFPLTSQN
jgi:hypothetical protein